MSTQNPQHIFQQNLNLINQIYPHYSELISSVMFQASPYDIQLVGEKYYQCQLKDPNNSHVEQWVHGPDDPWQFAEQAITKLNWQQQDQFIVFRPSLGYVPLTLYANLRKGRNAQRMLLLEDRLDLFIEALKRFDWTDMLRSDRVILVLNHKPAEAMHEFVRLNPVFILPQTSVLCGCHETDEVKQRMHELQAVLGQLSQTVNQATEGYLKDLTQHYDSIANDQTHQPKVLLVEPEHDYLAQSIEEAFQAHGFQTAQFNANQRMINFINPYVWLPYTREHYPDYLLWMNRNTLSYQGVHFLANFPIKKLLWFMDNPKRVETTAEELQASDYYFSFDPTYLPYLKELSGKDGYHLPTAAGIQPLTECEPDKPQPNRTGAAVGFVGALAASRFQDVRNYWLGRDPEFVTILDGIVEDFLEDSTKSLEERFNESEGRDRLPYSGFVVLYLEERATYLKRLNYLSAISDQGLTTYGSPEWGNFEWAQAITACYSGEAPEYREGLPAVYYHTQININVFHVQCINSTNPRVYDVLAAGGFLLTEYRPMVENEFEIGKHLDIFHSPDELKEKVEYYKQNPELRDEIAREGQKFVLEHATYHQRVKTMLNLMEKHL